MVHIHHYCNMELLPFPILLCIHAKGNPSPPPPPKKKKKGKEKKTNSLDYTEHNYTQKSLINYLLEMAEEVHVQHELQQLYHQWWHPGMKVNKQ